MELLEKMNKDEDYKSSQLQIANTRNEILLKELDHVKDFYQRELLKSQQKAKNHYKLLEKENDSLHRRVDELTLEIDYLRKRNEYLTSKANNLSTSFGRNSSATNSLRTKQQDQGLNLVGELEFDQISHSKVDLSFYKNSVLDSLSNSFVSGEKDMDIQRANISMKKNPKMTSSLFGSKEQNVSPSSFEARSRYQQRSVRSKFEIEVTAPDGMKVKRSNLELQDIRITPPLKPPAPRRSTPKTNKVMVLGKDSKGRSSRFWLAKDSLHIEGVDNVIFTTTEDPEQRIQVEEGQMPSNRSKKRRKTSSVTPDDASETVSVDEPIKTKRKRKRRITGQGRRRKENRKRRKGTKTTTQGSVEDSEDELRDFDEELVDSLRRRKERKKGKKKGKSRRGGSNRDNDDEPINCYGGSAHNCALI